MKREKEVQELAQKLDDWARKELPETQQTLLRLLLSREYRKIDTQIRVDRGTYVFKNDIKQAVMDALQYVDRSGNPIPAVPSDPQEDWPRGGPIWPRADSWARATWPRA